MHALVIVLIPVAIALLISIPSAIRHDFAQKNNRHNH